MKLGQRFGQQTILKIERGAVEGRNLFVHGFEPLDAPIGRDRQVVEMFVHTEVAVESGFLQGHRGERQVEHPRLELTKRLEWQPQVRDGALELHERWS